MFGSFSATGQTGLLMAGYNVAARLADWHISALDDQPTEWRCTARVEARDGYWFEHGSAWGLRLTIGRREWRWRNVVVQADAGGVMIRGSGPPEIRSMGEVSNGQIQIRSAGNRPA